MTESPIISQPTNSGIRIATMFLDHVFMCLITFVFSIPWAIKMFVGAMQANQNSPGIEFMKGPEIFIVLFGFGLYFCKDSINGRSIAKRILKLQVVNNRTGIAANPIRCFVRNIFILIWPIEALIAIINPSRRIGDLIAGTKLIVFNPTIEQPKVKIIPTVISTLLAFGIMLLIWLPFYGLISKIEAQMVAPIEASFNEEKSMALEQLLNDSLHEYGTATVKIYDRVKNENLKYIAVTIQLNENIIELNSKFESLNIKTKQSIYLNYPENSFMGKLQYLFQSDSQMQSRTIDIGVNTSNTKKTSYTQKTINKK